MGCGVEREGRGYGEGGEGGLCSCVCSTANNGHILLGVATVNVCVRSFCQRQWRLYALKVPALHHALKELALCPTSYSVPHRKHQRAIVH